jgi:hypothetical protein
VQPEGASAREDEWADMQRFVFAAIVAAALIACPTAMAQSAPCSAPADTASASSTGDDSGSPPAAPSDDSGSRGTTAAPADSGSGGSGGAGASGGSSAGATTPASSDTSHRPALMLASSGGSSDVRAQASQPTPGQGEEQPGTGQPGTEQPGTGTPGTEQPATGGGGLPRTGLDALRLFVIGVILLLIGARLHVLTRIREIPRRIAARRRRTDVALREAVENLRQPPDPGSDWAFPDPDAPAPTNVLPSTAVAKRTAGMAGGDPSPAG